MQFGALVEPAATVGQSEPRIVVEIGVEQARDVGDDGVVGLLFEPVDGGLNVDIVGFGDDIGGAKSA